MSSHDRPDLHRRARYLAHRWLERRSDGTKSLDGGCCCLFIGFQLYHLCSGPEQLRCQVSCRTLNRADV